MFKILLLWFSLLTLTCLGHVTFTNLVCSDKNKRFVEFELCQIKAVNRTHKYLSINGKLHQPIEHVTANFKVMRKDNFYKLFFFDYTVDVCKFLKNSTNPIFKSFYKTFKDRSNINHSCPYNHNVIIDKLWTGDLESDFLPYLPIPNGDYAIFMTYFVHYIERFRVNLYLSISN